MTGKENDIKTDIKDITADATRTLDERIDALFALKDGVDDDSEKATDAAVYRAAIDMIRGENALATHIRDLMQLYVLLAETLDEMDDYPPLNDLAFEVREVMRDERIAWEVLAETLPRFIDAMSESVFHHETYNLLLVYLRKAYEAGSLSEDMKGYARHLLKLRILLDDCRWGSYLFDKDLQRAIAALFTQEELVHIICNPSIGVLRADPVEYTWKWEDIYYEVEKRLEDRFANAPRQMGFCFRYWNAKRDLLKEEYGIDWRSPSQMNPRVMFD
ncbi:MAG: hypothetical protein K2K64_01955 [Muribaculaceae bacterium]|nr:hypothetical protein [Muribaculaceae bacterium]